MGANVKIAPASGLRSTTGEEIANAITHGVGAVLSLAGLVVMVALAALHSGVWQVIGCSIYASSLLILYLISTLYHSLTHAGAKRVFQILDHCSIFLFIAGSYTPFLLVNLHGGWGWSLLGIVWGIAVLGIIFKILYIGRDEIVSVIVYITMGWLILVAIKPLMEHITHQGLDLLVAGGLFYTIGVVFYALEKLPYNHSVWHIYVMAGSACHYFAILYAVLPARI